MVERRFHQHRADALALLVGQHGQRAEGDPARSGGDPGGDGFQAGGRFQQVLARRRSRRRFGRFRDLQHFLLALLALELLLERQPCKLGFLA